MVRSLSPSRALASLIAMSSASACTRTSSWPRDGGHSCTQDVSPRRPVRMFVADSPPPRIPAVTRCALSTGRLWGSLSSQAGLHLPNVTTTDDDHAGAATCGPSRNRPTSPGRDRGKCRGRCLLHRYRLQGHQLGLLVVHADHVVELPLRPIRVIFGICTKACRGF